MTKKPRSYHSLNDLAIIRKESLKNIFLSNLSKATKITFSIFKDLPAV